MQNIRFAIEIVEKKNIFNLETEEMDAITNKIVTNVNSIVGNENDNKLSVLQIVGINKNAAYE